MENLEIWKDIIGYEGLYQVSSFGRVKSLGGKIGGKGAISKEKILKNNLDSNGYYIVNLCKNSIQKTFKIHKLVAINFLGHIPNGFKIVVDHLNNDKTNNHVSNLQLISSRLNSSKDKKKGSSKFTGVSWNKNNNKWVSHIRINGKSKYLGSFDNEIEASEAYQKALNEIL